MKKSYLAFFAPLQGFFKKGLESVFCATIFGV
jgi:hypothetical protein